MPDRGPFVITAPVAVSQDLTLQLDARTWRVLALESMTLPACVLDRMEHLKGQTVDLDALRRDLEPICRRLKVFWGDMHELDTTVLVVGGGGSESSTADGAVTRSGSTTRKLGLEESCFLHITVDPFRARAVPKMRFSGPEKGCARLERDAARGRPFWDETLPLKHNLGVVLGVRFLAKPHPGGGGGDGGTLDPTSETACLICLAALSEADDVGASCQNMKCEDRFHRDCLREWLQSIDGASLSMGFINGPCPSCGDVISTVSGS
ncbi:hypothetical protein DFJ73DRAFT_144762 [Zopfochytrium polystomum]|nr:hypothetical protein DFJ73DRAFT_144762 [Zopfochytrium polystomum]